MNKQKATLVGITVVSISVIAIVVMFKNKPVPLKKPAKIDIPLVETVVPSTGDVQFEVTSQGVVKPRTETTLVSEVSGVVQKVSPKFQVGGYFLKGEALLTIDPSDYQVALEQAKARLASQKAQFAQEKARAEQARKEWDLSGRSRDSAPALALREPFLLEAQANVDSALADYKKAEQKLSRTIIRAPYDGMVKNKLVDVGQFVATGTQLGNTFAIDYAEVRLPLIDNDLAYIHIPNWNASSELSALPNVILSARYAGKETQWAGRLVRMEGAISAESRVHYAVVQVNDPYSLLKSDLDKAPLKIGSFVKATVQGKMEYNLTKIPRDAFKGLDRVLVSDTENTLRYRQLDVVRSEKEFVYIRSGLEVGDRIVITSIESPVVGAKVRVSDDEEAVVDPNEAAESEEQNIAILKN